MLYHIEISKSAIVHNLQQFRSIISPETKIMAVVKGNAYGHGDNIVSQIIEDHQAANILAVVHIDEAIKLRKQNITLPILVLGYTHVNDIHHALKNNIMLTVADSNTAKQYEASVKELHLGNLEVHIKFDTGLHRLGWMKTEVGSAMEVLSNCKHLDIVGIFSHLADAENPQSLQTIAQLQNFQNIVEKYNAKFSPQYIHIGASSATMIFPQSHWNTVRIGIGLYGMWPSMETYEASQHLNRKIKLQPVLTYKTQIVHIKSIETGSLISYGGTYRSAKPMKIAILPVGYAEGIPRLSSNKGYVLIQGKKCNILGSVCMNMMIVDITGLHVKHNEEAVLIGQQKELYISANDWAHWSQTVNYEITTRLPEKITRIIV